MTDTVDISAALDKVDVVIDWGANVWMDTSHIPNRQYPLWCSLASQCLLLATFSQLSQGDIL